MHKKLQLIFLLIILPSFQSHGQINELSMLGIGTDELTQAYKPKPEEDKKYIELEKPKQQIDVETQRNKFKDSEYGYSGGESFNNPQRSNLSEEVLEYFGYSYFLNGPDAFFSKANNRSSISTVSILLRLSSKIVDNVLACSGSISPLPTLSMTSPIALITS